VVALHARDLFHGNLKPSDILLHYVGSELTVHVTDYTYISYSLEHCYLTRTDQFPTLNYTAPEYDALEDADFIIQKQKCFSALQRVDVFSVGLILYEMLTGHEAFSSELSAADLRRKIQERERPPIPGSMKREVGQLIERCWDSDPTKRPSIGEVWHILKQMRFAIIEGVDSNYIGELVSRWGPSEMSKPI
jgi:serine/threonine protein kinase